MHMRSIALTDRLACPHVDAQSVHARHSLWYLSRISPRSLGFLACDALGLSPFGVLSARWNRRSDLGEAFRLRFSVC